MSVVEIYGGRVDRRYLMKKSKDELATMYLHALDLLERRTQPEATKPAQDLSAAIPDGWQLVPKEPTKEMLTKMATSCTCEECLTRHYKWMLDAAS